MKNGMKVITPVRFNKLEMNMFIATCISHSGLRGRDAQELREKFKKDVNGFPQLIQNILLDGMNERLMKHWYSEAMPILRVPDSYILNDPFTLLENEASRKARIQKWTSRIASDYPVLHKMARDKRSNIFMCCKLEEENGDGEAWVRVSLLNSDENDNDDATLSCSILITSNKQMTAKYQNVTIGKVMDRRRNGSIQFPLMDRPTLQIDNLMKCGNYFGDNAKAWAEADEPFNSIGSISLSMLRLLAKAFRLIRNNRKNIVQDLDFASAGPMFLSLMNTYCMGAEYMKGMVYYRKYSDEDRDLEDIFEENLVSELEVPTLIDFLEMRDDKVRLVPHLQLTERDFEKIRNYATEIVDNFQGPWSEYVNYARYGQMLYLPKDLTSAPSDQDDGFLVSFEADQAGFLRFTIREKLADGVYLISRSILDGNCSPNDEDFFLYTYIRIAMYPNEFGEESEGGYPEPQEMWSHSKIFQNRKDVNDIETIRLIINSILEILVVIHDRPQDYKGYARIDEPKKKRNKTKTKSPNIDEPHIVHILQSRQQYYQTKKHINILSSKESQATSRCYVVDSWFREGHYRTYKDKHKTWIPSKICYRKKELLERSKMTPIILKG